MVVARHGDHPSKLSSRINAVVAFPRHRFKIAPPTVKSPVPPADVYPSPNAFHFAGTKGRRLTDGSRTLSLKAVVVEQAESTSRGRYKAFRITRFFRA